MDFYTFMSAVFEHITVPIIILIGGAIIAVLKPYANKITNSLTMKNEMESLEKMTKAKSNLMEQLDKLVESAVASNMQLADKMKENGHKLTEDEIAELNRSAKDLVVSSLPIEVLDHEGDLYKLIGGDEKLDKMIMSLMEKHVYIYKLQKIQNMGPMQTVAPAIPEDTILPVEPEYSEEIIPEYSGDYDGDQAIMGESQDIVPDESEIVYPTNITSPVKAPARFGLG